MNLRILGTSQFWIPPNKDADNWLMDNFKGCGAHVDGCLCGSKLEAFSACMECGPKAITACMEWYKAHEKAEIERLAKEGNAIQRTWASMFPGLIVSTYFLTQINAKNFGHVNHNSTGLKAVCKQLGIKFTRKAIQEFLDAQEESIKL